MDRNTILSIHSFHDTPIVGGSLNPTLFRRDLSELCATNKTGSLSGKYITSILPHSDLIDTIQSLGARPIIRLLIPNNRFNYRDEHLRTTLQEQICQYPGGCIYQPFNEVNLAQETGNISITPEVHAEEFAMAAHEILSFDSQATILITPLARDATTITRPGESIFEPDYFRRMTGHIVELVSYKLLRSNFAIAMHSYVTYHRLNPLARIINPYEQLLPREMNGLVVHVTEGGFYTLHRDMDDHTVIDETTNILLTLLHPTIPVASWCTWVYGGLVQRPAADRTDETAIAFDRQAVRQAEGALTPLGQSIAALNHQYWLTFG